VPQILGAADRLFLTTHGQYTPLNFDFLCAVVFEVVDKEVVQTKKGTSLGELFGLGKGWPKDG